MGHQFVRRGLFTGLAAGAALVIGAVPALAQASPGESSAYGIEAHLSLAGSPLADIGPTPVAKSTGQTHATTANVGVAGVITASTLEANATFNSSSGVTKANAFVEKVSLPLLNVIDIVGNTPSLTGIKASCTGTTDGVTGSATLANLDLSGLYDGDIDLSPAPNTTITLTAPILGEIAEITFNEQIEHPNGSLTVNAVHIHLLAGLSEIAEGDVVISSATCGAAAPPVALASGPGLWLGLGTVGGLSAVIGVVAYRRRRNAADSVV